MQTENTLPAEPQEEQEVPQKPKLVLTISSDRQEADLTLQRVAALTANPLYEDIMEVLAQNGVVYGIDENVIRTLCEQPNFRDPVTIARGTYAQTGADGYVKYLIREIKELRPKLRENGTVDYRDLGFIQNVHKGQPLCEVHAPEKGADGCDVFGNVLEGRLGKEPPNVLGKNTELNPEKTLVIATCDGNADVQRGTINVVDVLNIRGNVDNSTGDINFVGDVIIGGDVLSGFNVVSAGSIMIKGGVEGAKIKAAGDITVAVGVNGMNQGFVEAGGTIKCKFVQNGNLRAGQNIYADSIMSSIVECSGNLELTGKNGILVGGRTTVSGKLIVKTIGTDSHIATHVTITSASMADEKLVVSLTQELRDIDANTTKMMQAMAFYEDFVKKGKVLTPEQITTITTVRDNCTLLLENRKKVQAQLEEVHARQQLAAGMADSYIMCSGRIHVGTRIVFGPLVMQVQDSFVKSRVFVSDGEITIATM